LPRDVELMGDLLGHFPRGAQAAVDEDVGQAIGRLARRQEGAD